MSSPIDVIILASHDPATRRRQHHAALLAVGLVLLGWAADAILPQVLGFLLALRIATQGRPAGLRRTPQQAADYLAITYGVTAARRPVTSGRIIDV